MNAYTQVPDYSTQPPAINLRRRPHLGSPLARETREAVKFVFWAQWAVVTLLQLTLLSALAVITSGEIDSLYRIAGLVVAAVSIPVYSSFGAFNPSLGYLRGLLRLVASWCVIIAALAAFAVATRTTELFEDQLVLLWVLASFVLQIAAYVPIHFVVNRWASKVAQRRRALIVGTGPLAQSLAAVMTEPLVGMVEADDGEAEILRTVESGPFTFRCLGQVSHLRSLIKDHHVSRVYIALPAEQTDQIEGLYVDLLDANVDVVWIPDVSGLLLLNHSMSTIGNLPAVHLNESPLTSRPGSALIKGLMDRTLAALGVIVLSPLLIAIAIAVKLSSPGPVFFRQQRHGRNGKIFEVLKFRSMRVHEDREVKQATKDDPRVTTVGRFIRKTSIDELPQLFNVIKGEMSLVGPRPHAVAHNDYYSDKIMAYMARHRILPGITGYAQIKGYRGETETLDKMAKRVELDLEYINNWSLWMDIKILFKTPLTLFSKNVY